MYNQNIEENKNKEKYRIVTNLVEKCNNTEKPEEDLKSLSKEEKRIRIKNDDLYISLSQEEKEKVFFVLENNKYEKGRPRDNVKILVEKYSLVQTNPNDYKEGEDCYQDLGISLEEIRNMNIFEYAGKKMGRIPFTKIGEIDNHTLKFNHNDFYKEVPCVYMYFDTELRIPFHIGQTEISYKDRHVSFLAGNSKYVKAGTSVQSKGRYLERVRRCRSPVEVWAFCFNIQKPPTVQVIGVNNQPVECHAKIDLDPWERRLILFETAKNKINARKDLVSVQIPKGKPAWLNKIKNEKF